MNLPRVLIIDDQYAWDVAARKKIMKDAGLVAFEANISDSIIVAEAMFCPGQTKVDGEVKNDYDLIHKTIKSASAGSAEWALILLDVRFDSGKIGDGDIPIGLPGDDSFGETVRTRLVSDLPGLPVVMLTSKHESELQPQQYPYLSKAGMTPRIFGRCLLQYGRLTMEQKRIILGLDTNIVADSPLTVELFRRADIIADTDASVLILGETGAGKEILARYLHNRSLRSKGPFEPINVAAIPADLVESELFGYEEGAFTGARRGGKLGKFELAAGGTLFLDEIGDMPAAIQAKVLRALQEKEVLRIGGKQPVSVDVRVLTATSRNISTLVAEEDFRYDLLRRICVETLTVPPLRERKEDIVPLAERKIFYYSSQYNKSGISLSPDAKTALRQYPFFANVGELENVIHRLVGIIGNNRVISGAEMTEALSLSMAAAVKVPVSSSPYPPISETAILQSKVASLSDLLEIIRLFRVDKNDTELEGAKQKVEDAMQDLLRKLAGAALERFRDSRNNKLNRQASMQFLAGDGKLTGKGPGRVINEVLGKKKDDKVSDDDLEELVRFWRETCL